MSLQESRFAAGLLAWLSKVVCWFLRHVAWLRDPRQSCFSLLPAWLISYYVHVSDWSWFLKYLPSGSALIFQTTSRLMWVLSLRHDYPPHQRPNAKIKLHQRKALVRYQGAFERFNAHSLFRSWALPSSLHLTIRTDVKAPSWQQVFN